MCICEFPALREKAKMIERLEHHPSRVMRLHHNGSSGGRNRAQQQKPYVRPQSSSSIASFPQSQPSS